MITVNSLSGGKTSSYMAYHYPADYNIFSLVRIKDVNCKPKDQGIIQYVSDKIQDDFIATAESDKTLYVLRDLEQLIGKEITWVTGIYFEDINAKKQALPNQQWRFCTTEMKLRPIWDFWYKNIREKIRMGIGFRFDEHERAERLTTSFKGIVSTKNGRNKWQEIEWREGYFPLIENGIFHHHVVKWAISTNLNFPQDSNCVGCFHKPVQQLCKNWIDEPEKMQWFANQENEKKRWKNDVDYSKIKSIPLQGDFFFGTGSGCQGGFCTD